MIGMLGHDLRNPLNAVSMTIAAVLRRPDLPDDLRGKMECVHRAAGRMTEMIGTLLDLARVGSIGNVGMSPAPADLGAIVEQVVDEHRAGRPERAIEVDLRGDLHGVWDPARVAQVVSNLVGNALEHGDPKAPVCVSADGEQADVITLEVRNQGPPIQADLIPVLFDPFVRGASAARESGLGLGLYIVKQIVVGHGGTISVESTAQTGTTFTMRVPRVVHRPPGGRHD
jgi:signal transduction histidine kinase